MPERSSAIYNPFEWPEYLPHLAHPRVFKPELVGTTLPGARWGIWPIYFEEYRSDIEPSLADSTPGPNRIMVWQRRTRTDRPAGWIRLPIKNSTYIGYFADLNSDYLNRWSTRAARYARHWRRDLKGIHYNIGPVTFDEFAAAYAESTVAKEIPTFELDRLKQRIDGSVRVSMWGVRRISDGKIMAGLSSFDSSMCAATHYSCGFYLPESRRDHLMVALMDQWFTDSLSRGLQVLHFGIFAAPTGGATLRGKTISDFKAQFITDYQLYQPLLFRFVSGTFIRA